ncbi:restriction endonuclease subunit S [Pseudomonas sp. RGM 3321]|uniref:restriction endonuclease subunit S n=1 Tax=Pseudomonas sp. RGM 3321 TaxID=2930089 RepID=UPI001FCA70DE|nr:restriction endonuclease subunit S [Pseudomonas sp. RGM 3321]MCJ2373762.1 restriction endonuclease subunit S [Pseudomonas sp. RGM 3321]
MSKLDALISLEYGEPLPAERRTGHGFPVFGSNGEVGRHQSALIAGPGIVVGRKGSVGKVTWSDNDFWPIDTTYWVNCPPEERRWLYWVLSWLPLHLLDTSTGIPGLNRRDVYELEVYRPKFGERRKIAQILDILDTAIRETEALIDKLKAVKQGLLHDLLTRGVGTNGQLRPPQSEAPQLYKESPLGWIPREWEAVELNQLIDPKRPVVYGILMPGYGYPGGVPVVKVKDIYDGKIHLNDLLLTSPKIDREYSRSRLKAGDLLFTIRGTVGRTAFVPPVLDSANITQDTARLAVVGTDARYLRAYLGMAVPSRFIATHTLGVAVQGINLRDVRRIPIARPSALEAKAIADEIQSQEQRLESESLSAAKLRRAKAGLMGDLLTGRVCVTPLLEPIQKATVPTEA